MDLEKLNQLQIFRTLTPGELDAAISCMGQAEYDPDVTLFERGDPGGTMYVVVEGLVEINAKIGPDLVKALANVPPGAVFGELSLFTQEARSAAAMTVERSFLLSIDTPSFERLLQIHPNSGGKILAYLTTIISDRLRHTTDLYRQSLEWALHVSGAIELHFETLITGQVDLVVKLFNGDVVHGQLLKVDQHGAGYMLIIKTRDGRFQIIPYHAITSMSFDADAVDLAPGELF